MTERKQPYRLSDVVGEVWPNAHYGKKYMQVWRDEHEKSVNAKIVENLAEKRKRDHDTEREVTQLVTQTTPFESLVQDWLEEQKLTLDARAFLLEYLIPTLALGVEHLLTEAERRSLIEPPDLTEDFNPLNFLAQFLMRNNPSFTNVTEASPYAKSIRKILDDLKANQPNTGSLSKLDRMKAEARKRQEELERTERINFWIRKGRPEALQEMFTLWTGDRSAVISLSLVQSALRSFQDYVTLLPLDKQKESMHSLKIEEVDVTGKLINIRDFVEYIGEFITGLSEHSFCEFMRHTSNLATEYRSSMQLQQLRTVLGNLFESCDTVQTGYLDRKRILLLLEMFYNASDVKQNLRHPKKWPIVELSEEEDEVTKYLSENNNNTQSEAENEKEQPEQPNEENNTTGTEDTEEEDSTEENKNEDNNNEDNNTKEKEIITKTDSSIKEEENRQIGSQKPPQHTLTLISEAPALKDIPSDDIEAYLSGDDQNFIKLDRIDHQGVLHFTPTERSLDENVKDIMEKKSSDSEPEVVEGISKPYSRTTAVRFDRNTLNLNQFVNLLMTFLGDSPASETLEGLVLLVRGGYVETIEERTERIEKTHRETMNIKRRLQVEQLFDLWDSDGSGYLEITEIEMVVSKWREDDMHDHVLSETWEVFEDVFSKITKKSFKKMIDKICATFTTEDVFDQLIHFLTKSVQRSFEERKRGDYRKMWLQNIDFSARTSGGQLDTVYKTTYQVIGKDAEKHGKSKRISTYIAKLEFNDGKNTAVKGETVLRYVSCSPQDNDLLLNRILHRGMRCISFSAVDSGKPIHVPRVLHHAGVHLWNPLRKEEKIEGSFIVLPLKDHEKNVIGILGVDTLCNPHDKAIFVTHEISFYQGVAKALSQAVQFVDARQKTIKISESAVTWILRRCPHVHEVIIYSIEPALKVNEGLVLRKMVTLRHDYYHKPEFPPRLERKDNLFKDYLFKCIDTSETLTADAYGERHYAFPLRDAEGMVVSIVDLSIGQLKQLPAHEMREVHRMLKLLEVAHTEMNMEAAGETKTIVLEVEKLHQGQRIEVLFDRIMLQDLRANVGRLDARAFAEIKSYKDPPKIIHDILKAVLGIYLTGREEENLEENLGEWTSCKMMVNNDLVKWITTYDPTAHTGKIENKLAHYLADVPPGAVAKQGSLPAQYLFNWAFVCLSLIEHANRMTELRSFASKQFSINPPQTNDNN